MTTAETTTVVTAVIDNQFHYARTPGDVEQLIDRVVSTETDRPTLVYVWDRPCTSFRDPAGPAFPDTEMRVVIDDQGWGALSYRCNTDDGELLDSYNPETTVGAAELVLDPEGEKYLPASAALPRERIRAALVEFTSTGTRPDTIDWQPGLWF